MLGSGQLTPGTELMLSVARRIVDACVLHLIKTWLECAVEETDDRGRKTRTTEAKNQRRGIPQGSPISPMLANLYMRQLRAGKEEARAGEEPWQSDREPRLTGLTTLPPLTEGL